MKGSKAGFGALNHKMMSGDMPGEMTSGERKYSWDEVKDILLDLLAESGQENAAQTIASADEVAPRMPEEDKKEMKKFDAPPSKAVRKKGFSSLASKPSKM